MDFEWDEAKSRWNVANRGFAFDVVHDLDWEASVTRYSPKGDEVRFITVGLVPGAGVFAVVWTPRLDRTRVISVRRVHRKEARKYGFDET